MCTEFSTFYKNTFFFYIGISHFFPIFVFFLYQIESMAIQKITKEEQEQVNQLKSKLNEIKQAANVNEGYELWNIALDQESTNPKLDLLLVKFLRAR